MNEENSIPKNAPDYISRSLANGALTDLISAYRFAVRLKLSSRGETKDIASEIAIRIRIGIKHLARYGVREEEWIMLMDEIDNNPM